VSVILAIDPGSERSAFVALSPRTGSLRAFAKIPNDELLGQLRAGVSPDVDVIVIEWMQPHGRPTSLQEFETLYWIGRFSEAAIGAGFRVERLARDDVKFHLTGLRAKVGDANVIAALVDRYGGIGGRMAAVGTKAAPGPLHGVTNDIWQALAVAVTWADQHPEAA
jgi:hypothetical protein